MIGIFLWPSLVIGFMFVISILSIVEACKTDDSVDTIVGGIIASLMMGLTVNAVCLLILMIIKSAAAI